MPDNVKIKTDPTYVEEGDMRIEKNVNWTDVNFNFTNEISTSEANRMMTSLSGGIFGMPYQFSEQVDTRIENTDFGRKYLSKIASVMPVMFITPGIPEFMAGYSKKEKKGILSLLDSDEVNVNDIIQDVTAPYYIFNSKFDRYVKYVNTMVRGLANLMGLSGERYFEGSGKLATFNLNSILNKDFQKLFNANTSVAFYLDAETSVSESFGNSTAESMLSSKINQVSDMAREIQFLAGDTTGTAGFLVDAASGISQIGANVGTAAADALGLGTGILGKLSSGLNTIVTGGRMVFPEIWASSEYSRSYNISMKLRSPDPDPLSILLNIYIPCCCLACLAMPMQMGADANGYTSPFLVRATYKSIFNCELGMVSSLDFQKGGEDKWNALGMPTSVDVNMTIKDLYSTMFMSKSSGGLLNNTAQLDYIALMAGLDMNKDWVARNAALRAYLIGADVLNAPSAAWQQFKTGANKTTSNFLKKIIGADAGWVN